jgi:hypothetical protein
MNHSIYSADRMTHLKIVIVALIAGIAIAGFGLSSLANSDTAPIQTADTVKPGKPMTMTRAGALVTR